MALKETKLQLSTGSWPGGGAADSATLTAEDIKELLAWGRSAGSDQVASTRLDLSAQLIDHHG